MTDELLYAKLATSIADTGSPLPQVHGTSIAVYNQLYPLLIAPLYGALSAPEAFRAAHVLNAFLMVSAVFPAYLLGRQVLSRPWALAAAGLSVLVPWMVLTGFLMTESAAYPAFLWALLGLQLAIAAPSPRRDLLAVAALGLAGLARTQFAVLVVVLPLAILAHEIGMRRSLLAGLRHALAAHRLLALGLRRRARRGGDPRARGLVREPPRRLRGDGRGRFPAPLRCLGVGGTASRCGRDRLRARAADPRRRMDARDGHRDPEAGTSMRSRRSRWSRSPFSPSRRRRSASASASRSCATATCSTSSPCS